MWCREPAPFYEAEATCADLFTIECLIGLRDTLDYDFTFCYGLASSDSCREC